MKNHIAMSIETLNKENIFDDQMRWEFLKFETRKFSTHCSISKTGERNGKGITSSFWFLSFSNKIYKKTNTTKKI